MSVATLALPTKSLTRRAKGWLMAAICIAVITLMLSSFTGGSIMGTSAALGTIGGIARIYESTGVKTALRRLGKMQGPKAERAGLLMLEAALKKAGMPASSQAATESLPMAVGQN